MVRFGARALAWEVLLILSGAALAAASEGLFVFVHMVSEIKTFPAAKQRRGLNNGLRLYCRFAVSGLQLLKVLCFGFMWITETTWPRSDD